MKRKILYIDDDSLNLKLFEYQFGEYYRIEVCDKPKTAVNILLEKAIHMVITDYRMPGINGLDLIRNIKNSDPTCICIMLTALQEWQINEDKSQVFQFISKPYNFTSVHRTIQYGFDYLDRHH